MTNDPVSVHARFAADRGIGYTLLADRKAEIISAFGLINERFPRASRWYGIALPMSIILYAFLQTVYNPNLPRFIKRVTEKLPYFDYFQWLRNNGAYWTIDMITDQLIPPRTNYLTRQELEEWFRSEDVPITSITNRYQISWRVSGEKP